MRKSFWRCFVLVILSSAGCESGARVEYIEIRNCARGDPCLEGVPYFEFEVDIPVGGIPSDPISYPEELRGKGVGDGEVLAQFVVDTTGRAEMSSYKVLQTTHELFGNAVRQVLPSMRFIPAEVGGRKVRQLVQTPFVFKEKK